MMPSYAKSREQMIQIRNPKSEIRNPKTEVRISDFGFRIFLLVLCAFLFFFRLGDRGLHSSHEARAAQNGQSILLNDDWLLPQLFDRQVDLQKPPLYYWLVAWLGWLNGGQVDAWAVRLPAALAALGCVLIVYELGRRR